MIRPVITYSETADALYVQLQEAGVTKVTLIDDARIVDYAADGSVVGVEFLGASSGSISVTYRNAVGLRK